MDVCLYDGNADKLIIVNGKDIEKYSSEDGYSPVGVVVVPGHHDVYKDGSCAIISLKYMNCDNPDKGSASIDIEGIAWGTLVKLSTENLPLKT